MKRYLLLLCFWIVGVVLASQPEYPPISADNLGQLHEVARYGDGLMNFGVGWSPDGSILIGGQHGAFHYDNLNSAPEFVDLQASLFFPFYANESLVFLSENGRLLAYDSNTWRLLYAVEGIKPLAVSHDGRMLAYEVAAGVRVLDIASGNLLYDLNYEGILEPEERNEDGWRENNFFFVQFFPDDSAVIIGWRSREAVGDDYFHDIGADVWSFDDLQAKPIQHFYPDVPNDANMFLLTDEGTMFAVNLDSFVYETSPYYHTGEEYVFSGRYIATVFAYSASEVLQDEGLTGIWDTYTGDLVVTLPEEGPMSFSPDGTMLAIGNTVYAIPSGEVLRSLHSDEYRLLMNIPDRVLWFDADNQIHLLDGMSFDEIALLPYQYGEWELMPGTESDGSFVLMREDKREFVRLDGRTGATITTYRSNEAIFYQYASSDLRLVYASGNSGETVWNYATGETIWLPESYTIISPRFHPDGALVVWDGDEVLLYDAVNAEILASFPYDGEGRPAVSFSSDGVYMAMGYGTSREIWRVDEQRQLFTTDMYSAAFVFSRDSQFLIYQSWDDELMVVQISDGGLHEHFNIGYSIAGIQSFSPNIVCAAYSDGSPYESYWCFDVLSGATVAYPDDSFNNYDFAERDNLVFAIEGNSLLVKSRAGQELRRIDLPYGIFNIALSSDGSLIYIHYNDGTLSIWAAGE